MEQMTPDAPQIHELSNERLRRQYADAGFSGRVGFGERPAVLVIDIARAWLDPTSPIGSSTLDGVLKSIVTLLAVARQASIPIFFTTMAYDEKISEVGQNVKVKTPHLSWLVRGSEWVQLSPELQRHPHEPFIEKQRASAFFGTTFLSQLVARQLTRQ